MQRNSDSYSFCWQFCIFVLLFSGNYVFVVFEPHSSFTSILLLCSTLRGSLAEIKTLKRVISSLCKVFNLSSLWFVHSHSFQIHIYNVSASSSRLLDSSIYIQRWYFSLWDSHCDIIFALVFVKPELKRESMRVFVNQVVGPLFISVLIDWISFNLALNSSSLSVSSASWDWIWDRFFRT
jgi:hypothetical protein